jgi:VanZ family protein
MRRFPLRSLRCWLPTAVWAATLFFLSSRSSLPQIAPGISNFDKIEHLGAYALLGLLVMEALFRTGTRTLPKAALLAILITSAYGASDEFHQRFVPNRSCDVSDWTADTIGGCLAAVVYAGYESRRSQKTHR